jgi:TolB protein
MTVMNLSVVLACSAPDDGGEGSAEWSIDTASVLFTATRDGSSGLYVLDRQTGEVRRVTAVGTEGGANAARVSPDGTRIAFQIRRDTDYEVHVMDVDGGQRENVSMHPEFDVNPVWSPDGAQLAFMSTRGFELGGIGPFPGHIYARALGSDSLEQITREPLTSSFGPSDWSSDGNRILIARNDAEGTDVFELDVTTGNEVRLTSGEGAKYSATYSHSGDRIAFHAEADGVSQIAILDLLTRGVRVITDGPGLRCSPQWSPDDSWLMFTGSEDGLQYDVQAVRVSDGQVIDIVATSEDEREGQWFPTGR